MCKAPKLNDLTRQIGEWCNQRKIMTSVETQNATPSGQIVPAKDQSA